MTVTKLDTSEDVAANIGDRNGIGHVLELFQIKTDHKQVYLSIFFSSICFIIIYKNSKWLHLVVRTLEYLWVVKKIGTLPFFPLHFRDFSLCHMIEDWH